MVTVEQVLDLLADKLIQDANVDTSMVRQNQKTIRNGLISIGRANSEQLILFEKDVKANAEDFLNEQEQDDNTMQSFQSIVDTLNIEEDFVINLVDFTIGFTPSDGEGEGNTPPLLNSIILHNLSTEVDYTVTNIFVNQTDGVIGNPINLSQFMNLQQLTQDIDIGLAEEYLDTTIFELLPTITGRQQRIINFFNEFQILAGNSPDFQIDNGYVGDGFDSLIYSEDHDISAAQDTPEGIQEEESFITRLIDDSNSNNEAYTLEGLRNTLNSYLTDIDEVLPPDGDERPEYKNESSGYLKFRNLNQGIIIRNTENKFLKGLNPETQDYLETGFTVTMWVKFLDKSSQGTLFNFGNPFREDNPIGFTLETYVLKRDDVVGVDGYNNALADNTWGEIFQDDSELGLTYDNANPTEGFFSNDNAERFIRLVVKDGDGRLRGSHVGMPFLDRRQGLPEFNSSDNFTENISNLPIEERIPYDHTFGLMTNTRVPINYSEWYFICATFNPFIQEDSSHSDTGIYGDYKNNSDFWKGNVTIDNLYTHHSTYGNKCKVEIMSKTDLLRARGFKV